MFRKNSLLAKNARIENKKHQHWILINVKFFLMEKETYQIALNAYFSPYAIHNGLFVQIKCSKCIFVCKNMKCAELIYT